MSRSSSTVEAGVSRAALRYGMLTFFVGACVVLAGAPGRALAGDVEGSPAARLLDRPRGVGAVPASGFAVQLATPEEGIEGELREGETSVFFSSRKVGGALTAAITDAQGATLYEYRDFGDETLYIQATDGSRIELRRPPELRIKGVLYGSSTPEQLAALRTLARSREGHLIRRLGLELYRVVPGRELVEERGGIELATQALWPHFLPLRLPANPLTSDYEVGPRGYLVLAQPHDLVLANNRAGSGYGSEPHRSKHDDNQVNDCFGRCGSGCTGGLPFSNPWPSQWVDTVGSTFIFQQQIRCVSGDDWVYTWYATPVTHTVEGYWSSGCQLHDNCCSTNTFVCYSFCNYLLLDSGILLASGGEYRTWTYTDYRWDIRTSYIGYSGCTCPGVEPTALVYECTQ